MLYILGTIHILLYALRLVVSIAIANGEVFLLALWLKDPAARVCFCRGHKGTFLSILENFLK